MVLDHRAIPFLDSLEESKLMGLGVIAGLVHGDFQIDNLVSHPIGDRVIGILD